MSSSRTPIEQIVDDYIQLSNTKSTTVQEMEKMIYGDALSSIHLYLSLLSFGNPKKTAIAYSTPAINLHGTDAQGDYIHKQAKQLYLSFLEKHEKALESDYKTNANTALFLIKLSDAQKKQKPTDEEKQIIENTISIAVNTSHDSYTDSDEAKHEPLALMESSIMNAQHSSITSPFWRIESAPDQQENASDQVERSIKRLSS